MSEFPTVEVRQGVLRGRRRTTPAGKEFLSFQGVPYAKPPVGALRFQAPQPPEPWLGVRDATAPGQPSVQYDGDAGKIVGDEDCLFLNVFTPSLPAAGEDGVQHFAVLFWIHGGGFLCGSSDMYQPEPFMGNDVVLVTINYRVGPLGFLSLGTPEAPGNAGLKDQTMALRWVKENIAAFGGDPDNVTIFGESAGACSVQMHVLSPLSKGLFHRAVVQSGSALLRRNVASDSAGRARRLALAAGCDPATTEDPAALLKWLRAAPAARLAEAVEASKTGEELRRGTLFVFVPCVEPAHEAAFLAADPAALLASNPAPHVPLVFGISSHEGMLNLPGATDRLKVFPPPGGVEKSEAEVAAAAARRVAEIASDLQCLLPEDLRQGRSPERIQEMARRLNDFYFGGKGLSQETLAGLVDLFTDANYASGVLRSAREHARLGARVFLYEFAFLGCLNAEGARVGGPVRGVCHGDELAYQFSQPGLPEPAPGSPEETVRQRINRLWTNFAKEGNPTPVLDEIITTQWLPYSETEPNYLRIDDNLTSSTGLLKERMQFWEELYKM